MTRRDHQSWTSVSLTSTSLSSDRLWLLTTMLIHPAHCPSSVYPSVCLYARENGYWSQVNEAGSRSLQQIYVLTDSGWRRNPLWDKVLSQSDVVCAELWGLMVSVLMVHHAPCSECKPKAPKRSNSLGLMHGQAVSLLLTMLRDCAYVTDYDQQLVCSSL